MWSVTKKSKVSRGGSKLLGSYFFLQRYVRQEFFKPKASITLDGWPLEFDWLEGQTFDKGALKGKMSVTRDVFGRVSL